MKIIYCAEINGEFAQLYTLLKESIADVYIIAGNLLDMPFYTPERFDRLKELQQLFQSKITEEGKSISAMDYSLAIIRGEIESPHLLSSARELVELDTAAHGSMLKKYIRLETILSTKSFVPILLIPGSADLPLAGTALAARSIDLNIQTAADTMIAGVGGSSVEYPGFPSDQTRSRMIKSDQSWAAFTSSLHVTVLAGSIPFKKDEHYPHPFPEMSRNAVVNGIPLFLCGSTRDYIAPWFDSVTTCVVTPAFRNIVHKNEGGFFHEINMENESIEKITLKKIVGDRIHDIAIYTPSGKGLGIGFSEKVIDRRRFDALCSNRPLDSEVERHVHIPELRLFRDIRNFFKIYQTAETEKKVEALANALEKLGDEYSDIALDLVGSTNIGVAQSMSDVDMVMYIRDENTCREDGETCHRYDDAERRIRELVEGRCEFELIDRVNLDLVEQAIREGDCESPVLQRFVVYRGMCRPVNYKAIAPVEDMLNARDSLRAEAEKSMSEYLQVFGTTKDTNRSFDKYQTRLKSMGVEIPPVLADKIRMFLQK